MHYISCLAVIEIECKVNTVLHHIHIHSSVVGTCCFPADIRVGVGGNWSSGCELASKCILLSCVHQTFIAVEGHGLISRLPCRTPQFQQSNAAWIKKERIEGDPQAR